MLVYVIAFVIAFLAAIISGYVLACIDGADRTVFYDEKSGSYHIEISEAYLLSHTEEEVGKYIKKQIMNYELEVFDNDKE